MSLIEFETVLHGEPTLVIPPDVVARLPKSGRATVVFFVKGGLVEDGIGDEGQADPEEADWRRASYEQFMKDDSSDDAVYDAYP
jgi:hypothetical protein